MAMAPHPQSGRQQSNQQSKPFVRKAIRIGGTSIGISFPKSQLIDLGIAYNELEGDHLVGAIEGDQLVIDLSDYSN